MVCLTKTTQSDLLLIATLGTVVNQSGLVSEKISHNGSILLTSNNSTRMFIVDKIYDSTLKLQASSYKLI